MTYSREFDVTPGSPNRSRPVEEEFDLIAAAMLELTNDTAADLAAISAALALKANIASPTFTGTVIVPAIASVADNSTKAATTAFVQSVLGAGGALLPPQTGNAGKYLTTDGSVASWGEVAALSWTDLSGKPTTLEGFGVTNGQHAIEFLQDGAIKGTAPSRINFRNMRVTASADAMTVEIPAFPHHLLLAQGII